MTKEKHPRGFVFEDGKVSGPLKVGISLEGIVHKSFVMREANVGDLLDAENEADVFKQLNFRAAMLARQIERFGDNKGPFTVTMLRRLQPIDWRILSAAQQELDALGKDASPAGEPS